MAEHSDPLWLRRLRALEPTPPPRGPAAPPVASTAHAPPFTAQHVRDEMHAWRIQEQLRHAATPARSGR
jgi:hypothetical protein